MDNWRRAGFGLYVHWPFCQAKCPYCDFNSHVVERVDQRRWARALVSEISRVAAETPDRVLSTIYFGGGTPSLMTPDTVDAVIAAARSAWHPSNNMEITLEANPTSVERDKFASFRGAGVNRVSIGVQALDDADLRRLGRLHDVAEARAAVETARRVFERVSFDLIYARQHQTLDGWRTELAEALRWGGDHLSLYQLTIEPDTAFGARAASGRLAGLPDEDLAADLYSVTQELCEAAGLPAYEVSNHAAPGAEGRHNLIYWRGGDWVGVGPGAHGRYTVSCGRVASEAVAAPGAWLQAVEKTGSGNMRRDAVTAQDEAEIALMMGLRLTEGVIDGPALAALRENRKKIKELSDIGLIEPVGDGIRATAAGRPVLNAVLRELLT